MDYERAKQGLTDVFRDVFDNPAMVIEPAMTAYDVDGWDSARMVELIMAAESHFGVKFSTLEVDSLGSVEDFIRLVERKSQH